MMKNGKNMYIKNNNCHRNKIAFDICEKSLYNNYRKWTYRNVCYHDIMINTTLPSKAKCSVFIYSLFVHTMYITVNKAIFIVKEIINPKIKNNIKSTINTTSFSHSKLLCSKVATLTSAFLFISYAKYYITFFYDFQANITKFYFL